MTTQLVLAFITPTIVIGSVAIRTWRDATRAKEMAEKTAKELKEHREECNLRRESESALSSKVDRLQSDVATTGQTLQWIGDCTVKIAAKMSVDLPNRP